MTQIIKAVKSTLDNQYILALNVMFCRIFKISSEVKTLSFSSCLWMSLSATLYLVRLIEPIFELFAICLVSCGRKLPYPDPLGSTASNAAKHETVTSRQVQE